MAIKHTIRNERGNVSKSSRAMRSSPKVRRSTAKAYTTMGCPIEREESMKLVAWARLMVETGQEPRLRFLRCGFEGLRLSMGVRMQVKRQSIATGWPDLFLAVPRNYEGRFSNVFYQFCGLFIELKRQKRSIVSSEQAIMIGDLNSLGYKAVVCKGADHAIETIKVYLGMK